MEDKRKELRDYAGRRIPPYLRRSCKKRFSPSGRVYYETPNEQRRKRDFYGY